MAHSLPARLYSHMSFLTLRVLGLFSIVLPLLRGYNHFYGCKIKMPFSGFEAHTMMMGILR